MRTLIMALGAVSLLPLSACMGDSYGGGRPSHYDSNRGPEGNYDAYGHYKHGSNYQRRHLSRNDRIYRGSDGRYYCQHNDGTTGLIVGAVGGGVLGNLIAPGGSETIGTLLGAAGGALLGQSIDKGDADCE